MITALPVWIQENGSIVDKNGLIIPQEDREQIIRNVHALPVFQVQDSIRNLLSQGKDLIIDGATWSGKSTWIPIFAREATWKKVIQTVPRVLSAMSLGEWISKYLISRTWDANYTLWYKEIGYRTWGWNSSQNTSHLSIHTDGLEMMREMYSKIFPEVLILDEVQNLSIATEVLMFIHKYRLDTQIVIMSATLNPDLYQRYMEVSGRDFEMIKIPGKVYPIQENFYENADNSIEKTIELAKEWKHGLYMVPGKSRMDSVIEALQNSLPNNGKFEIIALHAELTKEEQFAVMIPPKAWITRIIVATPVAEESITIPYLDFVVDEWTHKVGSINEQWIWQLRIEPATQANVLQRRGRVGRTHPGEYHGFLPTSFWNLHEYPSAEIEHSLLERHILLFEEANMGLYHLVSQSQDRGSEAFLHPVNKKLLNIGYERLTQIGALDNFWKITPLGKDILTISLDPSLWRMVIEGIKRGVTEEIIAIAAIFSVNSFLSKDEKWREIKNGTNKKSDLFMYLDLYDLVTKKQINQDILERLVYLWLDREQVKLFNTPENTKSLFEIVDLSPLGIKNHRIAQIYNKISSLQSSLISRWIQVDKKKKISWKQIFQRASEQNNNQIISDIITCIAAAYPYFTFEYSPEDKKLYHTNKGGISSSDSFRKAAISSVELSQGKTYIWIPFIIGSEDISDDLWLDIREEFFENWDSEESDLCIVSHITEIQEMHLKCALSTQMRYESVFPERKKQKNSIWTLEEYEDEYIALCEEYSVGSVSKEDFLINTIPLLLILKHPKFIKFIDGKTSDVVKGLRHRLRKFFELNSWHYVHRITLKIEDIDTSFSQDSEIESEFREWEQKNVNMWKKMRKKHIPEIEAEELKRENEMREISLKLQMEIWSFEGSIDDLDEVKLGGAVSKALWVFLNNILSSGKTFNILSAVFQKEIASLSEEERKNILSNLHETENSKSQFNSYNTNLSQLNKSRDHISTVIDFCKSKKQEDYKKIDFDEVLRVLNSPKITASFSKSQKEKLHNGIFAIHDFINDKKWLVKSITKLESAKKVFEALYQNIEWRIVNIMQQKEAKKQEIEAKKANTFETRRELHVFFRKYYESEYFNTVIDKKIPQILSELFTSWNDLITVIERWINNEFDVTKIIKWPHTIGIIQLLEKIKRYNDKKDEINRKISQYEKTKTQDVTITNIESLTSEIQEARKQLWDIKSAIFS